MVLLLDLVWFYITVFRCCWYSSLAPNGHNTYYYFFTLYIRNRWRDDIFELTPNKVFQYIVGLPNIIVIIVLGVTFIKKLSDATKKNKNTYKLFIIQIDKSYISRNVRMKRRDRLCTM